MASELKGVCVGAGYFSHYQYEAWQRIPEVRISACCNRTVDKAREIAAKYGIATAYSIGDFGRMLETEKPDFVDIITPPATHLDLCRIAAGHGVDIICQKPLAPTYAETLELAEIVRMSGRRFMVHENWRWQPWYRQIRRLLVEGILGEFFHMGVRTRLGDGWGPDAYLARQPFFRDYPRLFIFETGVHFLDTFRFLFGEVSSVYAQTARRNPVIRGEDSALVVCRFEKGGTAVLDANRYNECEAADPRYTFGRLRLDGSKGHLEMDEDGVMRIKPLGQPSYVHAYDPPRRGFAGDCVFAVQRHFVDCVLSGDSFESTAEDYLKTVRLVELAYESAATDQVIPVEPWGV